MNPLRIRTVGVAITAVAGITYALCVVWDVLLPSSAMHPAWQAFFPGFTWSVGGVALGLVEIVLYSFFVALVFVPIYNTLQRRENLRGPRSARA